MSAEAARLLAETNREAQRAFWNARAESFAAICGRSGYARGFLEALTRQPGSSVFDMGSGPGTLAIPLVQLGYEVMACDVSDMMLDKLQERAKSAGVCVETRQLSWQDDWFENGVAEKSYDMAIASRSITTGNLAEAFEKLERVARAVVAASVTAGPAEFVDMELMELLDRSVEMCRSDIDAFRILAERGRYPQVTYLDSEWSLHCASMDELRTEMLKFVGEEPLDSREQAIFDEFVTTRSVAQKGADGPTYTMDHPIPIRWALLIWEVRER